MFMGSVTGTREGFLSSFGQRQLQSSMAVAIPTFKEDLKRHSDVQGDDAEIVFAYFSTCVKRWQVEQCRAWKMRERQELEPWMREFVAAQYKEFLDTVVWNIPALEARVEEERQLLQRLQEERNRAVLRQCVKRLRENFCIGSVIIGLPQPDVEENAPERARSVLETMGVVYRYTMCTPPSWFEAAVSECRDLRLHDLEQDIGRGGSVTRRCPWSASAGTDSTRDSSEESSEGEDETMGAGDSPDGEEEGKKPEEAGQAVIPGSPALSTYSEVTADFEIAHDAYASEHLGKSKDGSAVRACFA